MFICVQLHDNLSLSKPFFRETEFKTLRAPWLNYILNNDINSCCVLAVIDQREPIDHVNQRMAWCNQRHLIPPFLTETYCDPFIRKLYLFLIYFSLANGANQVIFENGSAAYSFRPIYIAFRSCSRWRVLLDWSDAWSARLMNTKHIISEIN